MTPSMTLFMHPSSMTSPPKNLPRRARVKAMPGFAGAVKPQPFNAL